MLNMDLSKNVVIEADQMDWLASPSDGVERKPFEREQPEHGRTTSMVRFAPGSNFKHHDHPYGEEIFVLDGVFSDELGDYPKGCYLRNPPGTGHSPFSNEGCVLFVKLDQFDQRDHDHFHIDTNQSEWRPGIGGLQVMPLHEFEHEHVALVKWPAGERFQPHKHFGGEEIFVLSGTFRDEHGAYPAHSWIRSAHLSEHFPFVEEETVIWVKTGHLPVR
ncbi:MAG: anti-sigma factor ChrR (cupin superfamily) [Planctomycetota bacterium]|jgi:anti-sigma factor ChrR (cupin superfamily)